MESVDSLPNRYRYTRADMCILRREDYRPPKLASECDEILKNFYGATRPFFGGPPFGRGGRYRTKSGTQQDDAAPVDESQAQAAAPATFRPSRPYFGSGPPRRGGWPPTGYREREYRDDRADWRNVPDDRDRDATYEERERERGYAERGRGRGRYFAPADADRDWRAPQRPGLPDRDYRDRGAPYGERDRDRGAMPSSLARQRSTTATSTSDAVEQFVPSWEQKRIASETDREPLTPTGGKQRSDSMSERGHDAHESNRHDDDGKVDNWDDDADSSWTRVDSRRTGRKRSESATEWDERPTKGTADRDRREPLPSVRNDVKPQFQPQPQPQTLSGRSESTRQQPQTNQNTSMPPRRVDAEPAPPKPVGSEKPAAGEANVKVKRVSPEEAMSNEPTIAIDIRAAERNASSAHVLSPPSPTGIGAFSIDIAASLLESAGVDAGDDDELVEAMMPQRIAPTRSQFASLFGTDSEKPPGNGFGVGIGRGRPLANAAFAQSAVPAPSAVSFTDPGYAQALLRGGVRQEVPPADPPVSLSAQSQPVKWFYIDPQGTQQGPFDSSQMEEWFSANYFYPTLPVRRDYDAQFTQLGDLVVRFGAGIFLDRSINYGQPSAPSSSSVSLPQRDERAPRVTAPFPGVSMQASAAKSQSSDSTVMPSSDVLPFTSFAAAALGNALAVQPSRGAAPVNLTEPDATMALGFPRTAGAPPGRMQNQPSGFGVIDSAPLRGFGRGQVATATVSNNCEQLSASLDAQALKPAGNQVVQTSANSQKNVPTHADPYESIWDAAPDDDSVPTAAMQQMTVGQRGRNRTSTSSGSGRNEPPSGADKKLQQSTVADASKKPASSTESKQPATAALPPGVVDEPEFDIPFEQASGKKAHQRGGRRAKDKNKQPANRESAEQRVPEKAVGPTIATYESPVVGLVRQPPSSGANNVAQSHVAPTSTVTSNRADAKQSARPANANFSAWVPASNTPKWNAPPATVVDSAPLSAIIEAQRAEEQSAVRRELDRQRETVMNDMLVEAAMQQSGTAWASRVKQATSPPEAAAALVSGKKSKNFAAGSVSSQPPLSVTAPVVQPADFPALKPTQASASVDSYSISTTAKPSASAKPHTANSQPQQNRVAQTAASKNAGKQEKHREKDKITATADLRSSRDIDVLNDFRAWCLSELTKLRVNFDIETFVEYVNTIDADVEVEEYAIECIGESRKADARNFVRSYVERRKQIGLKQVLAKVHDYATGQRADAAAVQPQSNIEKHATTEEGGETGGKKKKNKNQRVDRSLLGYRVQTSRVMVGEIDTGQI